MALGVTVTDSAYLALLLLSVVWSWSPLTTVVARSLRSSDYQHYSHIILLPFLSAYLLYLNRDAILKRARPDMLAGLPTTIAGAAAVWLSGTTFIQLDGEHRLSVAMLGLVTTCIGGFVLCYGRSAFAQVLFPFLLLLFMVPLPPAFLNGVITLLQIGSTEVTDVLFGVIGMPVFREGFFFALPGMAIEVAKECSGIRSSLALMISGLVLAYLMLHRTWSRMALALVIVPLTIVKNAIRIVVLSWLAVHVDPAFITGSALHNRGGIPLFITSLAILGGLAWCLQKWERRASGLPR
jgi:exosortase